MKSKQELKKVFENGDKPKQEDFWEWQDSYWHKEESIPKEKIEGLELNSVGFNMQWSSTEKKLSLLDSLGNKISEISLQSLDNEGTDLRYNASTLSLELYNADNELLNSIPITDFVKNVGTQLSLNSNTLQLKDSVGNVLSTVSFAINNIQNLQTVLDGKLDRGTYTGTAQDIYARFEGKIVADTNNIPRVGNGASGKVLDNSIIYQYNGKLGVSTSGEPSEKLDVNGNLKADNLKAKSAQFLLQTSIVPTPNTLVPKTDGSGLLWYNNSSIAFEPLLFPSVASYFGINGSSASKRNIFFGVLNQQDQSGNGQDNTSFGYEALKIGTGTWECTAIGSQALKNNITTYNTAIGHRAMASNTTGGGVAIGAYALSSQVTGSGNTAIGFQSMGNANSSNNCTAIGHKAILNGGTNNIAVGNNALAFANGGFNTAMGYPCMISATGSWNCCYGSSSGSNISGQENAGFGVNTLNGITSGNGNIGLGSDALAYTGGAISQSIAIGWRAGSGSYTGSRNILIGYEAGKSSGQSALFNDTLVIGNNAVPIGDAFIYGDMANGILKFNAKIKPNRTKLPEFTKIQRNALINKEVGEMIWQTDNGNSGIRVFDGTNWLALQSTID